MQVPGNDNPCTLIAFATKSFNAGQIISKLHVIELGSHPGRLTFNLFFVCFFPHLLLGPELSVTVSY